MKSEPASIDKAFAMPEKFSWTASFGKWWGIPLHIHATFLLFAVMIFGVEWHAVHNPMIAPGTAFFTVVMLFFIAGFHELAHAFAASTLGGRLESLEITPWGGNSRILMPPAPREQLIVHVAGPFLNGITFLVLALLLGVTNQASLWTLVDPLHPILFDWKSPESSLFQMAAWINFQMFVVNMIPAFPFDASAITRSVVLSNNPRVSSLRLENKILVTGLVSGLAMFVAAWLLRDYNAGPIRPTWLLLVLAGVMTIFSARFGYHTVVLQAQIEMQLMEQFLPIDDYYERTSESEATESYLSEFEEDAIADWLHDQQQGCEYAENAVAVDEERRVDLILEKLHDNGIESLSDDEREFLNRISLQYRSRRDVAES